MGSSLCLSVLFHHRPVRLPHTSCIRVIGAAATFFNEGAKQKKPKTFLVGEGVQSPHTLATDGQFAVRARLQRTWRLNQPCKADWAPGIRTRNLSLSSSLRPHAAMGLSADGEATQNRQLTAVRQTRLDPKDSHFVSFWGIFFRLFGGGGGWRLVVVCFHSQALSSTHAHHTHPQTGTT